MLPVKNKVSDHHLSSPASIDEDFIMFFVFTYILTSSGRSNPSHLSNGNIDAGHSYRSIYEAPENRCSSTNTQTEATYYQQRFPHHHNTICKSNNPQRPEVASQDLRLPECSHIVVVDISASIAGWNGIGNNILIALSRGKPCMAMLDFRELESNIVIQFRHYSSRNKGVCTKESERKAHSKRRKSCQTAGGKGKIKDQGAKPVTDSALPRLHVLSAWLWKGPA